MKASYLRHDLQFKRPGGTSRGVLHSKETWYIILEDRGRKGLGECGILRGLSHDDVPEYEEKLQWTCQNIHLGEEHLYKELMAFPSIQAGLEMAFRSLHANDPFLLYPGPFTEGKKQIAINGLIWMGSPEFMREQIAEKLEQGFSCVKMKIGAIDFDKECELLGEIRKHYSAEQIELRVDANGAFAPAEALSKLKRLAEFDLHSIEQPIRQGQWAEMGMLCQQTPLPIALDEELIGVTDHEDKIRLLDSIHPQYLIFKPSFIGGFRGTEEWIRLAEERNIGWWVTSALESNVGLNAIAQWAATKDNPMPQGLGTGSLFTNNIASPLNLQGEHLGYDPEGHWDTSLFF